MGFGFYLSLSSDIAPKTSFNLYWKKRSAKYEVVSVDLSKTNLLYLFLLSLLCYLLFFKSK